MNKGIDKVREASDKIKSEQEALETKDKEIQKEVQNELAAIAANPELAKMYQDNASVGAENLGGSSPTLSIFTAGKSQSRLADGSKPTDGSFFYKPTEEQFKEIEVHILSISGGFRAEGMSRPGEAPKMVYNQLMSGLIVAADEKTLEKPLPFIMYMTGKKLNPMWDFAKTAGKWTHAKPIPIPMFALTIKLSTKEEANDFGMSWVPVFEIVMNEDGTPRLPSTVESFTFFRDSVDQMTPMMESIVSAKAGEDTEDLIPVHGEEDRPAIAGSVKGDDDIPF